MKSFKKLSLICLATFSFCLAGCDKTSGGGGGDDPTPVVVKKDFENLVFENKEFDYDGKAHSLSVSNVPEGAEVKYSNNNKTDVGVYTVKATVSKEDYNTKVLTAKLTIKGLDFEGVTLDSKSFDYDGKTHSLEVSGAPEGANIQYTNNSQINVGVYEVTAVISKAGYNTLTLKATLTIRGIDFEGVTFESKTFDYDGKAHSLAVSGAPSGAKVTYTNNSKINVGVYKVTAKVTKNGYNDLTLEATLTINAIDFEGLVFEDKTFEYDGKAHSLAVENVPTGARVTYNGNGKTNVGTYKVTATVSKTGYNTTTLTATLEITPAKEPIEVDTTKTAFPLNEKTTFDGFKDAIFGGNFTLELEGGTRFLYYSGDYKGEETKYIRTETNPYKIGVFGADGDKTYQRIATFDEPVAYETTFAKVVDDYAFSKIVDTGSSREYFTKIPAIGFEETFLKQYPSQIFDHVERTSTNGFEVIDYLDFHRYYATIEFSDNKFILEYHDHIIHDDIKRVTQEYQILTFSNVGNTKVNISPQHIGSVNKADTYEVGTFIYDGMEYKYFKSGVIANITLSYGEVIYLPKGHLKLLPDVYGTPIKEITMDFYTAEWGDHAADYTGFILDTEFSRLEDQSGDIVFKYCLNYKTYGYLKATDTYHTAPKSYFGRFESFGGELNYHGPDVVDIGFFQDRTSCSVQDLEKYNVSVINADYYTEAQIDKIQATGTKVFGYLNIGLISKSAPYYNDFKDIMLKDYELDSNYSWIDVSNSSWVKYVKYTLLENLCDRGLDGIYLTGTKVYEQYKSNKYGARQGISSMMLYVNYLEIELMLESCNSMMWDFTGDGTESYAPYYVNYYVQEEVFTKVTNRATNEFTQQSSEVESELKNEIINLTNKYKLNNEYKFNPVLLEYEVSETIDNKIKSYCEEMGYHCFISNKVKLN